MRRLLWILGVLWALPTTLLGLLVAILGLCGGARWQFHTGVLEVHGGLIAWLLEHVPPIPGGAMALTMGDVVLGRTQAALDLTRPHERVHVAQVHRWGPFFIPAYFLASLIAWSRGRNAYLDNRFEKEAYGKDELPRHKYLE